MAKLLQGMVALPQEGKKAVSEKKAATRRAKK
jgi:hypothetical protein